MTKHTKQAIIVGHRGAAGYAPENTLQSFRTAIAVGCPRTELDVHLSRDGEVVVIHDETVDRVSDGSGRVGDMSLAELKRLSLPGGQHIPTLQEVIDLCKNKIDLQIELKAPGTPELVSALVEENDIAAQVMLISFKLDLLVETRRINPALPLGFLFSEYSGDVWRFARDVPLDYLAPSGELVTPGMVEQAHRRGVKIYAYHVNEKEFGDALVAWGVDDFGTDYPKMFLGERTGETRS